MTGLGTTKPTFGIDLTPNGAGTYVTLMYNFHRIETPGAMCCGPARTKAFPPAITQNRRRRT